MGNHVKSGTKSSARVFRIECCAMLRCPTSWRHFRIWELVASFVLAGKDLHHSNMLQSFSNYQGSVWQSLSPSGCQPRHDSALDLQPDVQCITLIRRIFMIFMFIFFTTKLWTRCLRERGLWNLQAERAMDEQLHEAADSLKLSGENLGFEKNLYGGTGDAKRCSTGDRGQNRRKCADESNSPEQLKPFN